MLKFNVKYQTTDGTDHIAEQLPLEDYRKIAGDLLRQPMFEKSSIIVTTTVDHKGAGEHLSQMLDLWCENRLSVGGGPDRSILLQVLYLYLGEYMLEADRERTSGRIKGVVLTIETMKHLRGFISEDVLECVEDVLKGWESHAKSCHSEDDRSAGRTYAIKAQGSYS